MGCFLHSNAFWAFSLSENLSRDLGDWCLFFVVFCVGWFFIGWWCCLFLGVFLFFGGVGCSWLVGFCVVLESFEGLLGMGCCVFCLCGFVSGVWVSLLCVCCCLVILGFFWFGGVCGFFFLVCCVVVLVIFMGVLCFLEWVRFVFLYVDAATCCVSIFFSFG